MTVQTIERTLKEIKGLPAEVRSWLVEVGEDAAGEPAVWVWAILRDDTEEDWEFPKLEEIREKVSEAVRRSLHESPPWVYVRFRGESEKIRD